MPNISMSVAQLDRELEMLEFLKPIPNHEQLAKILKYGHAVSSRAYDDDAWTARFIASDGYTVKCFTVTDITIDQAEMIAAGSLDLSSWQEPEFREAVKHALCAE